jgi:predicted DNA-binding protein (UPF0251 family)
VGKQFANAIQSCIIEGPKHSLLLAYASNQRNKMSRPCKMRRVSCNPQAMSFRPCGIQKSRIDAVSLNLDELEAVRLADLEGLYQEQAADTMKISRQTFGNIIASAHKKIADFLIHSKMLVVEGGNVEIKTCKFTCRACLHLWSIQCGTEKPVECPKCKSIDFCCSKKIGDGKNFKKCWRDL